MGDANSWEGVFSFPADPPPAADTPHLPVPDRLSDEGYVIRTVRIVGALSDACTSTYQAPSCTLLG